MKNQFKISVALVAAVVISAALLAFAGENRLVVIQDGDTKSLPASSVTNVNAAQLNSQIIQVGTVTAAANGTVTNTFTTAFSAAPKVILVQTGIDTTITNTLTITSSNFIWACNKASQAASWIAVGAP